MNHSPIYAFVVGLLPCLIPPYAIRLNRVFGTKRVGWLLFTVFASLAALQFVRFWHPMGFGLDAGIMLDMFYLLIPFLLLTGMVHIETLFKERMRTEIEEKRMRGELEVSVKERTIELDRANEELQHEISLRRQGEAELRKSKDQYLFLFNENPVPMWIFDLQSGRFLAFNYAAVRFYGYTNAEFRELTVRDLYSSQDAEAFEQDCAKASTEARERQLWRHCRKDGGVVEVEVTSLDLLHGGHQARLVIAYDVSGRLTTA
jgi:PAS domain S-box-containing protein